MFHTCFNNGNSQWITLPLSVHPWLHLLSFLKKILAILTEVRWKSKVDLIRSSCCWMHHIGLGNMRNQAGTLFKHASFIPVRCFHSPAQSHVHSWGKEEIINGLIQLKSYMLSSWLSGWDIFARAVVVYYVMEVTNYFWFRSKRWKLYLVLLTRLKTHGWLHHRPKGDHTNIVLLNEH